MHILVVGGAGYIGSHMAKVLVSERHEVLILDNLSTGFRHLAKDGVFIKGDMQDSLCLDQLFNEHQIDAVMHFAAFSLVGESMQVPAKYYRNNVANTLNLLESMIRHEVKHFIFSSTAAIFGNPEYTPIDEAHPKQPINPYGASKLAVERMLQDFADAYGLKSVALRYFNACGADSEGELGECHDPETHLIPLILQAASGRRDTITIFGEDYPTDDGTCVRDYIHILDLCNAHLKALEKIKAEPDGGTFHQYNLGNGDGYSVKDVVDAAIGIVHQDGKQINVLTGERRAGDPAVLVADATKARAELAWHTKFPELNEMIATAWAWEKLRAIPVH